MSAIDVLRAVEWSGEDNVCPACGEYGLLAHVAGQPVGGKHRDDCALAAALRGPDAVEVERAAILDIIAALAPVTDEAVVVRRIAAAIRARGAS